ncbi:MAG: hypothetical protein QOJ73_5266 [Streptosporangiaceae bacterium]|jgi:tetratricopeptide (TPR) repeat protein|nr:hypothetical protein [Streptosporangiaceae bacterium]
MPWTPPDGRNIDRDGAEVYEPGPDDAAEAFALALRQLRDGAGRPSYRQMAHRAHCSAATLCRAIAGDRLPGLDVALGFAEACGGDRREWAARWRAAAAAESAGRPRGTQLDELRRVNTAVHFRQARGRVTSAPMQLPSGTAGFVGRASELAALQALVPADATAEPADSSRLGVIATITGMAGTGKTTLAVRFARQITDRFADGQLYLDLRGFDPAPALGADEALGRILRSLGVDTQEVPPGAEERALMYRSLLATQRMIVVLDNAASVEQVCPLLPGAPTCLVLVTSRRRLTGLVARYGVHQITLDVLSPAEALLLLSAVIGPARIAQETRAAMELARLCGYLPLALRIAAANLACQPDRLIAEVVAELAENQLAELEIDEGSAVSAAFELSYRRLDDAAARLFRLLGLIPGPNFTPAAAAAIAGMAEAAAARLLAHLSSMHLVEVCSPGRYQFHDLVRLFARDRSHAIDPAPDRDEAADRLLAHYLQRADAATRHLYPRGLRLPGTTAALEAASASVGDAAANAWLEDERPNYVAAVRLSTGQRKHSALTWQLTDALHMFFELRRYTEDWSATAEAGLAAALHAGDLHAEAAMRRGLANSYLFGGWYPRAAAEFGRALEASRGSGWRACEASVLSGLATAAEERDSPSHAIFNYRRALQVHREIHDRDGEVLTLCRLGGGLLWKLGRLEQARGCLTEALEACRQSGPPIAQVTALINLGNVVHEMGCLDEALALLTEALMLSRAAGFRAGEAVSLCDLGGVHRDLGRYTEAIEYGSSALDLARENCDIRVEAECLNALADYHLRTGFADAAASCARQALRLAHTSGYRHGRARALNRLASAMLARDELDAAAAYCAWALELTRRAGYRMLEGIALGISGRIALARGESRLAIGLAQQAVTILQETGHRPGETAVRELLDEATRIAVGSLPR